MPMNIPKNKKEADLYLEIIFMLSATHGIGLNELINIADNEHRLRMLIAEIGGIEQNIETYKMQRSGIKQPTMLSDAQYYEAKVRYWMEEDNSNADEK
jgi:hypothetical protein